MGICTCDLSVFCNVLNESAYLEIVFLRRRTAFCHLDKAYYVENEKKGLGGEQLVSLRSN